MLWFGKDIFRCIKQPQTDWSLELDCDMCAMTPTVFVVWRVPWSTRAFWGYRGKRKNHMGNKLQFCSALDQALSVSNVVIMHSYITNLGLVFSFNFFFFFFSEWMIKFSSEFTEDGTFSRAMIWVEGICDMHLKS